MKAGISCLVLLLISLLIIIPTQGESVRSSEIITQIENGQSIDYSNRVIEGDLIFGKVANEHNILNSEIKIENCTIMGMVDFRGTTFKNRVNLVANKFNGIVLADRSTQFNQSAIFFNSNFSDIVSFQYSNFNNMVSFANSKFSGANFRDVQFKFDAIFRNCTFNSFSYFNNAFFWGNADFEGSKFNEKASFYLTTFKKDASFRNLNSNKSLTFEKARFNGLAEFPDAKFDISTWSFCNFKNSANFNDAYFKNIAFFRVANFEEQADFEISHFLDDAVFTGCIFNKSAKFGSSEFKKIADYSDAKFKDSAEFIGVSFYGDSKFNNTQFNGDLSFEDANFAGYLYLTKAKYSKIYIRWNNIYKLGYDDAAYISLLENFKKLGMLEDADSCYYDYRKERRGQNWTLTTQTGMLGTLDEPFRKTVDYFLDALYAYGVDPLRPIYYSLIIIVLFAILWRAAGIGKPFGGDGKRIHTDKMLILKEEMLSLKEPFIFSILVFISAAKFLVETTMPKIPDDLEKSVPWSKYVFSIERILAGLLLALFFLAVSRTIVRNA
jgi:hypothetical protein